MGNINYYSQEMLDSMNTFVLNYFNDIKSRIIRNCLDVEGWLNNKLIFKNTILFSSYYVNLLFEIEKKISSYLDEFEMIIFKNIVSFNEVQGGSLIYKKHDFYNNYISEFNISINKQIVYNNVSIMSNDCSELFKFIDSMIFDVSMCCSSFEKGTNSICFNSSYKDLTIHNSIVLINSNVRKLFDDFKININDYIVNNINKFDAANR